MSVVFACVCTIYVCEQRTADCTQTHTYANVRTLLVLALYIHSYIFKPKIHEDSVSDMCRHVYVHEHELTHDALFWWPPYLPIHYPLDQK